MDKDEILDKIASALSLEVSDIYGTHWMLKSLKKGVDRWSNVELSTPGNFRLAVFSSRDSLLQNILSSKTYHIPLALRPYHNPFAHDWLTIENPFCGLTMEEAAVKADLEGEGGSHGQSA